ncbi:FabD/lysophospholipase-like protein [Schizophyllum commune Tattone D]|nr:FabD/lysophospholipase-like protein [Schizophyllum commune Tattone D]
MPVRPLSPASSWKSLSSPTREAAIQEVYASLAVPGPGVRLLAFDDGGIRGLTMLLLLRKLFLRIQQASCLPAMPLPCEYFDIIAGSGTGGFIALLLGRLRLSIETAIECYARLVRQVFAQIKGDGSFPVTPLEKVLKEVSRRYGDGEDTPIIDTQPVVCKTFVCAREDDGRGNITLRRIRTYAHPIEPGLQCTLTEAVRATMGHPAFFKPLSAQRGNSTVTFLDAGDEHRNPVFDLLDEADLIYPARHIAYYLSLGAGTASTVGENSSRLFANRPRLPTPTLTALRHIADCCDARAASFEAKHEQLRTKYYRLTPSQPLRDGRIPWEEMEDLDAIVTPYFASVKDQVRILAGLMKHQKALIMARGGRN